MVAMILGGICLVYFVILLSVGMDFSVIWLLVVVFSQPREPFIILENGICRSRQPWRREASWGSAS